MAWRTATLLLETSSCPAVTQLAPDARLRCNAPGGATHSPFGIHEGALGPGWEAIAGDAPGRRFALLRNASCSQCPLKALDGPAVVVQAELAAGRMMCQLLVESPDDLAKATNGLRSSGQSPRLLGCAAGNTQETAPPRMVDAGHLTDRQWQTLVTAARCGYFDRGRNDRTRRLASGMGCGPATANEHLRKALARLTSGIGEGAAA